jgi:hypothetical protein
VLSVVADTNTRIPGRAGNFSGFSGFVEIDGTSVGFRGDYPGGGGGLFVSSHGGLRLVVDTDTPVPGGTGKSTFLGKPSISGQDPAPQVRLAAVRPLVRAGGAWAQGYLARAAQDPDPAVATAARRALAAAPQQQD